MNTVIKQNKSLNKKCQKGSFYKGKKITKNKLLSSLEHSAIQFNNCTFLKQKAL